MGLIGKTENHVRRSVCFDNGIKKSHKIIRGASPVVNVMLPAIRLELSHTAAEWQNYRARGPVLFQSESSLDGTSILIVNNQVHDRLLLVRWCPLNSC